MIIIDRPYRSEKVSHAIVLILVLWSWTAAAGAEDALTPAVYPDEPHGHDFITDAKALYRVAACTGDDPLPATIDAEIVAAHCREMLPRMEGYAKKYLPQAKEFIAKLIPAGLPSTVVYPFGGGDLLSALTTFPTAQNIVTISMEYAGDPRRFLTIPRAQLSQSLRLFRRSISGLLNFSDSLTDSLQAEQRGGIPGQLAYFLVGLSIQGYEPVSVRYFRFQPDGSLHYITLEDIAQLEKKNARRFRPRWANPDFSVAFSDVEIAFRPRGSTADTPVRIHRHIAADLTNDGITPELFTFLTRLGRVTAMTKAASYTLWSDNFMKIRNYLLSNMAYMISDSTGIPPKYAAKAGFEQKTLGKFTGSLLKASAEYNNEFRNLWKSQPYQKVPFRYGYVDATGNNHML